MPEASRQRIDRWLFFARVVKSRSLAARLVEAGRVRVNGDKIGQASHSVKPGDVLTVSLDRRIGVFRIAAPGERRGPYSEARTLYEDLSPEPAESDAVLPDALPPIRQMPDERPPKRARGRE
ncbi:MAG: RNA-binding S4 domain-containing protein [Rhizobiales bacterium]|nr:RNA-binding S4 domain-containing protein [Hyphomicrobiales bacterium]